MAESACIVDSTGRIANLKSNLQRGFPICVPQPSKEGPLAVVASGPSVADHLDELRQWPGEIWAINGAYDYLQAQGIIPQGFFAVDPVPGLAEYVKQAKSETTFYLASVCDPSVMDELKGHSVQLWHGACEDDAMYPKDSKLVAGGTTAVTRAPFLALMLGWRDITLFGVDSSYILTSPYCYSWGTYKEDTKAPISPVMINGEGPFYSEMGLLKQISQIHAMLEMYNNRPSRINPNCDRQILKVRAAGLLDAFLRSPMLDDSQFEVVKEFKEDDAA